MFQKAYVRSVSANDALPLEHKLENRHSLRNANLSDFLDNPSFFRFHRSEECGFQEKTLDIFGRKICVLDQDVGNH